MATIINARDVLLQAATPRLLWSGARGISVKANTTTFSVSSGGVSTPYSISFTTTLNGVNGVINWSVPFGTATLATTTGTTNTLTYINMVSKVITVRVTVIDGGVTYTNDVTISANVDGINGTDAKIISLSTTSQIFLIPKTGVVAPTSVVLTATRSNLPINPTWSILSGTATLTSVSGDTATLLYSNMTTDAVTIKVTDATNTYSDVMTIVKVREGVDAVVGYLTNESVTLPASAAGVVSSYTGASGNFIVYYGAANITSSCTFSVLSNPSSLTPSSSIVTTGGSAGTYNITGGLSPDAANVTYRATYTSPTGGVYTIDKVFSIAKSKVGATGSNGIDGVAGSDAKLMSLSATSQVFQISKNNVVSPSSITLTGIRNNIAGTTFSVLTGTATLTSISGDAATLLYSNMTTDSVTIKVTDTSTLYSDTITIVKVREGNDSLTGYLTNESVTLPASTIGTVSSYAGANGNFIVYLGSFDVTSSCTFSVVSNPDSLSPSNSIVTSGASAGQYAINSGMSAVESSFVKYRATYTNAFGGVMTLDKVFSLTKSKTGATGATGSNGIDGASGTNGSSARIAYTKTTTTLSPTPSTSTVSGDSLPTTGTWAEVVAWTTYPPIITAGEQVWQTTGIYNPLTNQTTWVTPYLSNLKVGTLSALTVNTGTLTVDSSGYIRGGQTDYNTGSGFWLGYNGTTYKMSIGNASGAKLTYDGTSLKVVMPMGVATFGNLSSDYLLAVRRESPTTLPSVFLTDTSTSAREVLYVSNTSSSTTTDLVSFFAEKGRALSLYSASTTSEALRVRTEYATSPAATFTNIALGTELSVGGSYAAYAGSGKGKIYAVDGFTAFTGVHYAFLDEDCDITVGDIVCDKKVLLRSGISNTLSLVATSKKQNDKSVVGVYAMEEISHNSLDFDEDVWYNLCNKYTYISMNSVGEGQINVCGLNGDIEVGDLITSSIMSGKGQRQDCDNVKNYTVAKARESVIFDTPNQIKTIACIYLCG